MRTEAFVVAVLAGALGAGAAFAADVPVTGRKLVVTDKLTAASRAKVVFVALDAAVTKGAGTDPATIQATFDVSYAGTSVGGHSCCRRARAMATTAGR